MCSFPTALSENSSSTSKPHFIAFPCHSTSCLLSNYRTQFSSDQTALIRACVQLSVKEPSFHPLGAHYYIHNLCIFISQPYDLCVRGTGNIVSHTSKAEKQFNKSQQVTYKPQNTCYRCDLPKPN